MFGPAKSVVKKATKLAGRAASEAGLAVTQIPGGDAVPLRRMGFAVSMVGDPRGSTLLEVLGNDCDERAQTVDRFLTRCTDDEISELLAAFQEAAVRRAARKAADGQAS